MKSKNKNIKGEYRSLRGVIEVAEFRQMLFESFEFFDKYAITHILFADLLFAPADERGQRVRILRSDGEQIHGFLQQGAYNCAADFYENTTLEPITITESSRSLPNVPLSPL